MMTSADVMPFQLAEYDRVDHDIVYGLGGRWISQRLRLRDDEAISRDEIVARIRSALVKAGWTERRDWTRGDKAMGGQSVVARGRDYVLSEIYETSSADLYFHRRPFPHRRPEMFHNQFVHVSPNARIVALYWEAGW